jgi:hypothetical protein
VLTTLSAVSLPRRCRGAREYIAAVRPTVEERFGLLEAALWPSADRYSITGGDPPVDRDAARARAAELRAAGWSYRRIAAEVGVPAPTIKDWVRRRQLERG